MPALVHDAATKLSKIYAFVERRLARKSKPCINRWNAPEVPQVLLGEWEDPNYVAALRGRQKWWLAPSLSLSSQSEEKRAQVRRCRHTHGRKV